MSVITLAFFISFAKTLGVVTAIGFILVVGDKIASYSDTKKKKSSK